VTNASRFREYPPFPPLRSRPATPPVSIIPSTCPSSLIRPKGSATLRSAVFPWARLKITCSGSSPGIDGPFTVCLTSLPRLRHGNSLSLLPGLTLSGPIHACSDVPSCCQYERPVSRALKSGPYLAPSSTQASPQPTLSAALLLPFPPSPERGGLRICLLSYFLVLPYPVYTSAPTPIVTVLSLRPLSFLPDVGGCFEALRPLSISPPLYPPFPPTMPPGGLSLNCGRDVVLFFNYSKLVLSLTRAIFFTRCPFELRVCSPRNFRCARQLFLVG